MVKTSTLFYLVDDIEFPTDMILSPAPENLIEDEHYLKILDLLVIDPGEEVIAKVLDMTGIKKAV